MEPKKSASITGAGSRIGEAVAFGVANAGYRLVICGRRMDPVQKVSDLFNAVGGKLWPLSVM